MVSSAQRLPPPWAIGATGDLELARAAGEATAIDALAHGVAVVFAPVLDVADVAANPIVATRAFGADPHEVARFGTAWIEGCAAGGAAAIGKHYPGHGSTTVDSHLELPVVTGDRKRLESVEEVPFRAAIAAGIPGLMIGHLHAPALEPSASRPATLSRAVITDRLRGTLGFDGVIFTDALDMGAIDQGDGRPEQEPAVVALLAGADVPLLPADPHRAARSIRDAVRSGALPIDRLEDAAARIESLLSPIDVAIPATPGPRPETTAVAREISRRSVVRSSSAPRVDLRETPVELIVLDDSSDEDARGALDGALRAAGIELADRATRRLVVVLSDVLSSKGRIALAADAMQRLREALTFTGDVELLIAGPPQAVPPEMRPESTTVVFDTAKASLDAAASVLTDRLAATGRADWS